MHALQPFERSVLSCFWALDRPLTNASGIPQGVQSVNRLCLVQVDVECDFG